MVAKIHLFMHMLNVLYFIYQTLSVTTRQVKTNIGDMITADRPDAWHVTGTRLQHIKDTNHRQNKLLISSYFCSCHNSLASSVNITVSLGTDYTICYITMAIISSVFNHQFHLHFRFSPVD